jgi:dihydrofolate synthase/folylpolyglutamate synthase
MQALLCVQAMKDSGVSIPDEAVYTGLSNTRWPGRFEVVSGKPTVVMDGAHNINGAECFRQALDLYFPDKEVVLLLGMVREKDRAGIAKALTSRAKLVICTQPGNPRALPAEDLAAVVSIPHEIIPSPVEAFERCKAVAGEDEVVAVAGSLYLLNDVRVLMNRGMK